MSEPRLNQQFSDEQIAMLRRFRELDAMSSEERASKGWQKYAWTPAKEHKL